MFFLFGWLVLFHLKKYGLKGSFSENAIVIFSVVMVALAVAILIKFFLIDWEAISWKDFIDRSEIKFLP
ncbi:MAG: hypothetical protein PHI66_02920 [Candidatus Pacebacteria bacterium]|nr:hypothetical protein [Candidatus Paceibacterota bacterium]